MQKCLTEDDVRFRVQIEADNHFDGVSSLKVIGNPEEEYEFERIINEYFATGEKTSDHPDYGSRIELL